MPDPGQAVQARLKWFNASKGFGFVAPLDGSPDAFLHKTTLDAAGLPVPHEGATMLCEIGSGTRGAQVMRVMRGDPTAAQAPPPADGARPDGARHDGAGAADLACRVRWYSDVRHCGFLTPEDGSADVFIDAATLRRAGMMSLAPGQRVAGRVVRAWRGREARAVRLL